MRHHPLRQTLVVLASLACLLVALPLFADSIGASKSLGIGLGGGTSTSGLTAKYYLGKTTALQGFVGLHAGNGTSLGADYIMEFPDLAAGSAGRLFWGAGLGAGLLLYSVGNNSGAHIGVSGVVELGWHFASFPLELIADWRPTFWIGDHFSGLHFEGGGGAIRWFF